MPERYDAIIIGAGPAGEVAATRLPELGLRTALIERELVGGECAYWACIPSKTLLRPPEVRGEAKRTAGVAVPAQSWPDAAEYRDFMIRDLDDSKAIAGYRSGGVDVYKSEARILGPGKVEIAGAALETERLVIATGSDARVPEIPGLREAGYWTNREATTTSEVPASVVILGGGPVGVELGQLFRRFGAEVVIVEKHERLLAGEDAEAGELIGRALGDDGVVLRLGAEVARVTREGPQRVVQLEDGSELRGDELIVAVGREPRVPAGLEELGVTIEPRGVQVDERCRAGDGVWAVGDVTGVMPFTHVAMYQARVACADMAGETASADYTSIPRVVFSDPEVAAVGLTLEQARERGLRLARARIRIADEIARPWTYERDPRGELGLLVDTDRDVLIGAWAVAPLAGEWIHYATLAIKTQTPLKVLRDTVAQFPTFSEAFSKALERVEAL